MEKGYPAYQEPRDQVDWIFLPRALERVGKCLFADEWCGDEVVAKVLPDFPTFAASTAPKYLDLRFEAHAILSNLPDYKPQPVMTKRAPLPPSISRLGERPAPPRRIESRTEVVSDYRFTEADWEAIASMRYEQNRALISKRNRFHQTCHMFLKLVTHGKMRTGRRQKRNAVDVSPIEPKIWSVISIPHVFSWFRFDPDQPARFNRFHLDRMQWVFVSRADIDNILKIDCSGIEVDPLDDNDLARLFALPIEAPINDDYVQPTAPPAPWKRPKPVDLPAPHGFIPDGFIRLREAIFKLARERSPDLWDESKIPSDELSIWKRLEQSRGGFSPYQDLERNVEEYFPRLKSYDDAYQKTRRALYAGTIDAWFCDEKGEMRTVRNTEWGANAGGSTLLTGVYVEVPAYDPVAEYSRLILINSSKLEIWLASTLPGTIQPEGVPAPAKDLGAMKKNVMPELFVDTAAACAWPRQTYELDFDSVSPHRAGYMPLSSAAYWIASEGCSKSLFTNDEALFPAYKALCRHIADGSVNIIGYQGGASKPLPTEDTAGFGSLEITLPFHETPLSILSGNDTYLAPSVPAGSESMDKLRKHKVGAVWERLEVRCSDIAKFWPCEERADVGRIEPDLALTTPSETVLPKNLSENDIQTLLNEEYPIRKTFNQNDAEKFIKAIDPLADRTIIRLALKRATNRGGRGRPTKASG